ncbi:MAG: cyanoexosortase A system-associated protein [Moorea sp. SIO3I8]|nr:cyanoexosortase A system-associated protein [Moorena sp. SIO3I8]
MLDWKSLRIWLLAFVFGATLSVMGKVIWYPTTSARPITPFEFPATVPLPEWQPLESQGLTGQTAVDKTLQAGKHYRYIQNDLPLDIKMRYLVQSGGDINKFLQKYIGIEPASQELIVSRQQKKIGFHRLFVYQERAYLSSCINPRGGSMVTSYQFKKNRDIYDVRSRRLLLWLLGQVKLQDNRCLWAHLSIPLENSSPEAAYQVLENVWPDWYDWWYLHFPKP